MKIFSNVYKMIAMAFKPFCVSIILALSLLVFLVQPSYSRLQIREQIHRVCIHALEGLRREPVLSDAVLLERLNLGVEDGLSRRKVIQRYRQYVEAGGYFARAHSGDVSPIDIPSPSLASIRRQIISDLKALQLNLLEGENSQKPRDFALVDEYIQFVRTDHDHAALLGFDHSLNLDLIDIPFFSRHLRSLDELQSNPFENIKDLFIAGFESLDSDAPQRGSFFYLYVRLMQVLNLYENYFSQREHRQTQIKPIKQLEFAQHFYWHLVFGLEPDETWLHYYDIHSIRISAFLPLMPFTLIDIRINQQTPMSTIKNYAYLPTWYFRWSTPLTKQVLVHNRVRGPGHDGLHDIQHGEVINEIKILMENDSLVNLRDLALEALKSPSPHSWRKTTDQIIKGQPSWYEKVLKKIDRIKDPQLRQDVELIVQQAVFEEPTWSGSETYLTQWFVLALRDQDEILVRKYMEDFRTTSLPNSERIEVIHYNGEAIDDVISNLVISWGFGDPVKMGYFPRNQDQAPENVFQRFDWTNSEFERGDMTEITDRITKAYFWLAQAVSRLYLTGYR